MAHGVGGSNRDHLANYKPPDGGWGWVVVFASFVIHFIMDGIIYSLGTYLTAFTDDFHVSHGEASLVHSLLPAVTLSTGSLLLRPSIHINSLDLLIKCFFKRLLTFQFQIKAFFHG